VIVTANFRAFLGGGWGKYLLILDSCSVEKYSTKRALFLLTFIMLLFIFIFISSLLTLNS